MPFTPAHPAAILPLLRRGHWVSAALVAGSIAPDLPTYVPLGLTHEQTHPLTSILWPDSLVALGALLVWWGPLRPALMSLWPAAAARCGTPGWRDGRIWRSRRSTASWLFWVALSGLVGLATHLLWDGFTHHDGYFVLQWPSLRDVVAGHAIYNQLQFWCSIVGMAIVGIYLVAQWRRRTALAPAAAADQPPPLPARLRYAVIAVILVATALAGLLTDVSGPRPYALHQHVVWRQRLVVSGGVLLVLLSGWALAYAVARMMQRRRVRGEQQERPHTAARVDVP